MLIESAAFVIQQDRLQAAQNHRRMRDVAPDEKTSGLPSRAAASSKPRLSTSGFVAHMFADQRA
jgi:hypothetical protein